MPGLQILLKNNDCTLNPKTSKNESEKTEIVNIYRGVRQRDNLSLKLWNDLGISIKKRFLDTYVYDVWGRVGKVLGNIALISRSKLKNEFQIKKYTTNNYV